MLKLKAPKLDGTLADVSLLRPDSWLTLQAATVGGIVYISVPECGIDGNAKVLAIEDCPPIAANLGPGFQIVTGTFQHQAAQTLDIAVEGEPKPIGTTPNHPIWSVDRQAFVRADSLTVGERLQSLDGIARVTKISPRGPPEPVYNLEVQVKHTYYVADSGVLVHNGAPCPKWAGSKLSEEATQEAADSMARRISSLRAGSTEAIESVAHVGSRRTGWSKIKERPPLSTSDVDIAVNDWSWLKGSRHENRVIRNMKKIAGEFEENTGLTVELHLRSRYPRLEWEEFFGEFFK